MIANESSSIQDVVDKKLSPLLNTMSLTNKRKDSSEVAIPQPDPKRRASFDEKDVSPEMLTKLEAFYNDQKKSKNNHPCKTGGR